MFTVDAVIRLESDWNPTGNPFEARRFEPPPREEVYKVPRLPVWRHDASFGNYALDCGAGNSGSSSRSNAATDTIPRHSKDSMKSTRRNKNRGKCTA